MKKIIVLFIFLFTELFALEKESTLKMYHGIFFALSPKPVISVYTTDQEYRNVFTTSNRIFLAKEPEESDIILITNRERLDSILKNNEVTQNVKKPILFVTDYHFLKDSEDIIGAFYWRKGRSQLLFIKKRLDKQHIILPIEYQKFMIDEL